MSDLETRPQLAPGLRVVRRGLDHLQIGLYAGRRVLLPRTEPVERTLSLLMDHRPPPDDPHVLRILDQLNSQGLLTSAQHPASVPAKVALLGAVESPGLMVRELLGRAGLGIATSVDDADVVLVAGVGEVDRDRLDPLVRHRLAHLVLRLVDGGAIVGPFVVPGVTACLRCIDAHRSVADSDHVAVTTRYVQATARGRPDGIDDVADPALASLAMAWAVRDVVAHLAGREPSTWSRTLSWSPEPGDRREELWQRHPECGCTWLTGILPEGNR